MKTTLAFSIVVSAVLLLYGCTPDWDLQGHDPVKYYTDHPIKNKVESRNASVMVHFKPQTASLVPDEITRLHQALQGISPPAVDSITVRLAKADMKNGARKAYLAAQLRRMGYRKHLTFEPTSSLARGDADIDVAYLAVIPPDCPDWRTSPVTSYSNTWQGNFHCAQEVNTGLMVADPHDLVKGSDAVTPDSDRDAKVIEDYRSDKGFDQTPPWDTSSGAGGATGAASTGASGGR